LSHGELSKSVKDTARVLSDAGLGSGDVVSIVLGNSPEFVVVFLAVAEVGAVAAPLNAAYTEAEFRFYIEDAGSKVVVVHANGHANRAEPAVEAAKGLSLPIWAAECTKLGDTNASIGVGVSTATALGEKRDPSQPSPEDEVLFLHTSGTTSRPKGVPLSHRNLVTSLENIAKTYDLTCDDTTLLVMPLFHVHGLIAALLTSLAVGGTVVIPSGGKFSASAFWPSIVKYSVTWYTAVPTIHQVLLLRFEADYPKASPPKLRFIRSCSASLAPAVLEELEEKFGAPVLEAYAMTEAAHQMTSNPLPSRGMRRPGSVGIGQNVEIAILDEKNNRLGPGQIGEVCIRGSNVTAGYKNNPEANASAFAGGMFHTGDQGCIDGDGYLTLTGRIKELINRGGEKISPLEIDSALLTHPSVAEAVAFAAPDPKYGEEVNAAVVLKPSNFAREEDIRLFLTDKLAPFKVPKKVFFDTSLPRTATGKVQRRFVAQHFLSQASPGQN